MTVLAAFAIDDMLGLPARAALTRMVLAVGILFACVAIPFQQNAAGLVDKDTPGSYSAWFATSIEIAALTIALLVVASFCKDAVRRTIAIGIIVGVQIVGSYALPSLSYPRDGRIELGSVGYLRAHLGLQRFYSLGPLAPNYGSYYGAASINHNDLPIAKRWVDNVVSHLDPCINPIIFTGTLPVPTPSIPGRDVLLTRNVREFEKTGVKFVVTSPDSNLETKRLHARCRFVRSSSARADEKRPGHLDDGERPSGSARPNKYSGGKLPEHFGWDTACNRLRRGALLSHASRASYVNRHTAMPLVFYRSTASRGRLESRLRYNVYLARFHSFYGNTAAGLKTNHHWHKTGTCSRVNRSASRSSLIRRSPTFGSSTVMSYPRSTNCRTPHHTIRLQTACYRTKGAFTLRRLVGRQVRSGALSSLWTGGPSASMDPLNRCH